MNFSSVFKSVTAVSLFLGMAAFASSTRADILQLINGDHYSGTVISMTPTNLEFRSDIQGLVKIPRNKVANIALQPVVRPASAQQMTSNAPAATVQAAPALPGASANASTNDVAKELQKLGGVDQKTIEQIQQQLMGNSNPEVTKRVNEMVGGLMSGKVSVNDIRSQAKGAISQIQAAKKDLGPEAGDLLDGYLGILEKFVAETETSTPDAQPKTAPGK